MDLKWNWSAINISLLPWFFFAGWMFFIGAWKSILSWNLNMFTLIGMVLGIPLQSNQVYFPRHFPAEFKTVVTVSHFKQQQLFDLSFIGAATGN
jgi:Cu2+-exporting ATPase